MTIKDIAQICHQANKALCEVNGDWTQQPWEFAEAWQQESAINGVRFALANPDAPDSAQHDAWMTDKINNGWVYGKTKDAQAKTHPCLKKFEGLAPEQQAKDALFAGIVRALSKYAQPL